MVNVGGSLHTLAAMILIPTIKPKVTAHPVQIGIPA